jgi:hypothetical protein
MTLEFSDLDAIKDNALKAFDRRLAGAEADAAAIEREALRLETQLEQLYSFTAALASREPDVVRTAELWRSFVNTCDLFAGKVAQLSERQTLCASAYDRILEIRADAEEMRALHSP